MFKLALAVVFIVSLPSQARIFLEPYVGYYMGDTDVTQTAGNVSNDDTGMVYGARLGFTLGGYLFAAGDASLVKGEYKNSSTNVKEDLEILTYSAVAGIRYSTVRAWYGHSFKVDSETEDAGVVTNYDGTGWKAGLGVLVFGKISLNFEYIQSEVEKMDGVDIPNASISSVESSGYQFTISFPL